MSERKKRERGTGGKKKIRGRKAGKKKSKK